jgi:hypothetical protein
MRLPVTILLVLLLPWYGLAQQNHFIYIQSDNKQPFYVKLNNKVYSSSYSGYLILPKLTEDDLGFVVGFPKNEFPEQPFFVNLGKNDAGYNLKNFGEKGWGLFNLQSLATIYTSVKPVSAEKDQGKPKEQKQDAFTDMLVQVTGDSSIKESLVKEEKPKQVIKTIDTVAKPNAQEGKEKPENKAVQVPEILPVVMTPVIKATEFINDESYSIIYLVDNGNKQRDTVSVIIPIEKDTEQKKIVNGNAKTDVKFLDIEVNPASKKDTALVIVKDTAELKKEKPPVVTDSVQERKQTITTIVKSKRLNADCGSMATEDDFKKLRKKMAAETNDDAMIYEARKQFRLKCYTTGQIKNLGSLFLTDASRYSFYDAAYSRVFDPGEFETLLDELKEEYYKTRFKAMLRQ